MMGNDADRALEAIAAEIRGHRPCGFECCETCGQLVPGEGDARARVVFVGEAPGATEDETGRPFAGRAGGLLDLALAEAGLRREDVFITNVVKARPPGNRDPTAAEVRHHLPWLEQQLALIRPRVIVPVGRHALAHFAPGRKITEVHGTPLERDGRRIVPWLHPAAALRSPRLRDTLVADARALPRLLANP